MKEIEQECLSLKKKNKTLLKITMLVERTKKKEISSFSLKYIEQNMLPIIMESKHSAAVYDKTADLCLLREKKLIKKEDLLPQLEDLKQDLETVKKPSVQAAAKAFYYGCSTFIDKNRLVDMALYASLAFALSISEDLDNEDYRALSKVELIKIYVLLNKWTQQDE